MNCIIIINPTTRTVTNDDVDDDFRRMMIGWLVSWLVGCLVSWWSFE
jgi:hypothetical protein